MISADLRDARDARGSRERSPRLMPRVAGVLYLLAVVSAVFSEFVVPGRLGLAAIVVPVSCYAAVTLVLYGIFRPVNRRLSMLAVCFNLVGLAFEAVQLQPRGVNLGMVCHGCYCLLIGYLIRRSTFMPRVLGVLMTVAGLVWLMYLSPVPVKDLAPYRTAVGILGEAAPMLWLLVMGVNVQRWWEMARVAEDRR